MLYLIFVPSNIGVRQCDILSFRSQPFNQCIFISFYQLFFLSGDHTNVKNYELITFLTAIYDESNESRNEKDNTNWNDLCQQQIKNRITF